ncbi:MAG: hypothetical protein HDS82_05845 [Bacteroidales bacterium]|nr:hypothetical protein [Bacteroidales bacterium]
MENTQNQGSSQLLEKAIGDLMTDMASREIGAIIWDNSTAGFHYLPEVTVEENGKKRVARVTGMYRYDGRLYLIEEDVAGVDIDRFYDKDSEVKPTVVTLTEDMASRVLGDPRSEKGYTTEGSLEEWVVVADDYYEALTEYNPPL